MEFAGIVEHDAAAGTYILPAGHAQLLTRDGDVNMAIVTQFFSALGGVEDNIVDCFRNGGAFLARAIGQTSLPFRESIMSRSKCVIYRISM